MMSYLREPLVHFVLLGAALFVGDALWQNWQAQTTYTIRVSPEEMRREAAIFATENRREPTDVDLENLLFAHVEERVLMREAKRIGLDEDDTIIRRRLAQKMRFMIDDVGDVNLPSDTVLKDWFDNNQQKFMRPETRDFEHIFFSFETGEAAAKTKAQTLLDAGIPEAWQSLGDAFRLSRSFKNVSQAGVIKDFGRGFAQDIFALPDRDWRGPIQSAFGFHLVRVTNVNPRAVPDFETIRADVETLWLETAARDGNLTRLEDLIEKYDVVIDE